MDRHAAQVHRTQLARIEQQGRFPVLRLLLGGRDLARADDRPADGFGAGL